VQFSNFVEEFVRAELPTPTDIDSVKSWTETQFSSPVASPVDQTPTPLNYPVEVQPILPNSIESKLEETVVTPSTPPKKSKAKAKKTKKNPGSDTAPTKDTLPTKKKKKNTPKPTQKVTPKIPPTRESPPRFYVNSRIVKMSQDVPLFKPIRQPTAPDSTQGFSSEYQSLRRASQ